MACKKRLGMDKSFARQVTIGSLLKSKRYVFDPATEWGVIESGQQITQNHKMTKLEAKWLTILITTSVGQMIIANTNVHRREK